MKRALEKRHIRSFAEKGKGVQTPRTHPSCAPGVKEIKKLWIFNKSPAEYLLL